jgi:hypothetical protein
MNVTATQIRLHGVSEAERAVWDAALQPIDGGISDYRI